MTKQKEQAYIQYLLKVIDVLQAHVQCLDTQAKMIDLRGVILGKSFDTSDELRDRAEQLREHACYIHEVVDNPQLLTMQ